ncbi:MAG: hypothetical protein H6579_10905 [Chitinophagales bacterium]|nr:hypothetical protein [Chitinophagales bacterium]
MNNPKVDILFVVSEFWQAGTQRFTYEVASTINRQLFNITILSLRPLGSNENWADYYYEKHLSLGDKIVFFEDLVASIKQSKFSRIKNRISGRSLPVKDKILSDFFEKYQAISILGEYNFPFVAKYLNKIQKERTIIHIMNSIHQYGEIYSKFNKQEKFLFCSGFLESEIQEELKEFSNYEHYYLPLSVSFLETEKWSFTEQGKKKIGIFTRLTLHKPLDPFFYAFHLLLDKFPEVELHIYGSGDPEESGMLRYVKQLNLQEKVIFRGHQTNLIDTALNDKIDLVWFHSYYGQPGGFASFDISSVAIPQLFWNFSNTEGSAKDAIFPIFNHLNSLVDRSVEILSNCGKAEALSKAQYEDTLKNRNMKENVVLLESLYQSIVQKELS